MGENKTRSNCFLCTNPSVKSLITLYFLLGLINQDKPVIFITFSLSGLRRDISVCSVWFL